MKLYGRRALVTPTTKITPQNIIKVWRGVQAAHNYNAVECLYLYNYVKGMQGVEEREKPVRPEIKNDVTQNHAYEIVNFKTNYLYGDPIRYVRNGDEGAHSQDVSDNLGLLNQLMASEGKHACDREMGFWQFVCGTGYRWVYPDANLDVSRIPDDAPFEIAALNPIRTFVVYSQEIVPQRVLGGYELPSANPHDEAIWILYTRDRYYKIQGEKILDTKTHYLGEVPIIEYPANTARLSVIEVIKDQLDNINRLQSNRVDGVEQLVQAYLVFKNAEVDEEVLKAIRKQGAIQVASVDGQKDADVKLLSVELSQNEVQVLVDDLYQSALQIVGVPDREGGSRSTGDTQQAVQLRDGWEAAESDAKGMETLFEKSEKELLKIVLKILKHTKVFPDALRLSDIKIQFTRNRTDNIITKTQGMLNQLNSGIHPRTVIANAGLYGDPEQVYLDSEKYLEKWLPQKQEPQGAENAENEGRDDEEKESPETN